MNEAAFQIWLGFGLLCVIAELLIPGLVIIFIGLGSFTVALGMHLGMVTTASSQIITFFCSSIIYLFTLRVLVIHFFPSDAVKENVNEDDNVIGQVAMVVETIPAGEMGRVKHSDSTWQAKSNSSEEILKGDQVKIIGRDNITWLVGKI